MLNLSKGYCIFSVLFLGVIEDCSSLGISVEENGVVATAKLTIWYKSSEDLETQLKDQLHKVSLINQHKARFFRDMDNQKILDFRDKLLLIKGKRLEAIVSILQKHPSIDTGLLFSGHAKDLSDDGFISLVDKIDAKMSFDEVWRLIYELRKQETNSVDTGA